MKETYLIEFKEKEITFLILDIDWEGEKVK